MYQEDQKICEGLRCRGVFTRTLVHCQLIRCTTRLPSLIDEAVQADSLYQRLKGNKQARSQLGSDNLLPDAQEAKLASTAHTACVPRLAGPSHATTQLLV